MKNPIISELRALRDKSALENHYDIDLMASRLSALEPWMEKRTANLSVKKKAGSSRVNTSKKGNRT
jgi:hypothetical protein